MKRLKNENEMSEVVFIYNRLGQFALTFVIFCNIGITNGQNWVDNRVDHLEPVVGIYNIDDYQFELFSKVRKGLFSGLSNRPEIRYHVMPSFSPESVLNIEFDRSSDKYFLIYQFIELWYDDKGEKVTVMKFKTKIDKASVILIKSLFSKAIAQVRYPPPIEEGEIALGLDGEHYYFTVNE